jgi:hypothetical protein
VSVLLALLVPLTLLAGLLAMVQVRSASGRHTEKYLRSEEHKADDAAKRAKHKAKLDELWERQMRGACPHPNLSCPRQSTLANTSFDLPSVPAVRGRYSRMALTSGRNVRIPMQDPTARGEG